MYLSFTFVILFNERITIRWDREVGRTPTTESYQMSINIPSL
jgi:hypothetical protein